MARLILPTIEQWKLLEALGLVNTIDTQGMVIVAPWVTDDLTIEGGDLTDPLGLRYINIAYDNGGDADIQLDIIRDQEHYGINVVRKHANLPLLELEDDELLELERDWVEFDMDWDDDADDDEYERDGNDDSENDPSEFFNDLR